MRKSSVICIISVVFLISLMGTYGAIAQATKGLVLAMTFDEKSGDKASDASGYGNHGKVNGKADWKVGKFNNAFHLDGTTSISVPNKDPLTQLTHPMTVGCWVNPDSITAWHNIVEMDRDAASKAGGWKLGFNATKNIVWTTYGVKDFAGVTVVDVGKWTHVAATWDGAQVTIYINGKAEAPIVGGGVINVKDTKDVPSLDIGWRRSSAASFFLGFIDDLFIYNRLLTAKEITDLMAGLSVLAVENHDKAATTWGTLKF
ncbi:MAG: LamG domain-containing protein [Candidatus Poribacteria bacterium]